MISAAEVPIDRLTREKGSEVVLMIPRDIAMYFIEQGNSSSKTELSGIRMEGG